MSFRHAPATISAYFVAVLHKAGIASDKLMVQQTFIVSVSPRAELRRML